MKELPFTSEIFKIILSAPIKGGEFSRIEIIINNDKAQASMYTAKQVFHKNMAAGEVHEFVKAKLAASFSQYTAWDGKREYSARVTKKGKLLVNSKANVQANPAFGHGFNKQKNHILQEGDDIPVLVDMGIFTKELKVAANMYDKFQQINRFLELIADETKNLTDTIVNIIDFGCGKSYLTFLVYHYFFTQGLPVNICGLDLNASVIETCRNAAKKYNYTTLDFKIGDIGSQNTPPTFLASWGSSGTFNIVISLHACDTATDHALYNAVQWEADLILAAPCCQHELRKQMKPATLDIFSSYGIIEERVAALATDAIRAKLLESVGYSTQIIEFAPLENTAKNLLIRAKRGRKNPAALESVRAVMKEFGLHPTLYTLLCEK